MNWKLKAQLQNLIGILPEKLSYTYYYWLQRNFGSLRDTKLSPVSRLKAGIETCKKIEQLGASPVDSVFLEISTGRRINAPLAFWLLGAKQIFTIDLNPYLKEELVKADLNYIVNNKNEIENLFEDKIHYVRLDALIDFVESNQYTLKDLLAFLKISYVAPGDAQSLDINSQSIDFHTSYTVLEHIPPETIKAIIREGKRILKSDGLFVHKIDYTDHFSHSDKSISSINFLQFSDKEWQKVAGNRFMYMNRLRHDDLLEIFSDSQAEILLEENAWDDSLLKILESIGLDQVYAHKSKEVLKITSSWIVASKL
jgi:SAM-dependent methyltransferase